MPVGQVVLSHMCLTFFVEETQANKSRKSDIFSLLELGDDIMADIGFGIEDLPVGVTINTSLF